MTTRAQAIQLLLAAYDRRTEAHRRNDFSESFDNEIHHYQLLLAACV
jgi:hypothetical protein